jgi:hypothetical protein
MQPKDKFVMELGKPASTKPPPSDSATATSSESATPTSPERSPTATSPPELNISHVISTCYLYYITIILLLSIHALVYRMLKMVKVVVAVPMTVAVGVVKMKSQFIAPRIYIIAISFNASTADTSTQTLDRKQ